MFNNQTEEVTELIDSLSNFPHIQYKLRLYWGYKECRDYLASLPMTTRPKRQGFPLDAIIAIDKLIDLHDLEYPRLKPTSGAMWY